MYQQDIVIPDWMTQNQQYHAIGGRENFATKSALKLVSVLSQFRENGSCQVSGASAIAKLIFSLYSIVLIALSSNMFFTYILLAVFLCRICLLKGGKIKTIFQGALLAGLLSALFLLPSVFLGHPQSMLTISLKVFLSTGILLLVSATTPWNKLIAAFRFFKIPNIFLFTLDTTLRYIVLLGDISRQMLQALCLRMVGKHQGSDRSFAGILGTTFLKSQEMSQEMYQAMVCRGFNGEYPRNFEQTFCSKDVFLIVFMAGITILDIYLNIC